MESWEALKTAADKVGTKALAAKLKLSTALVYKWCQAPKCDDEPEASGARNQLDRLKMIYDATGDDGLMHWLCVQADGFFVPNPDITPGNEEERLLSCTQRVVEEFSNLLADISRGVEDDGAISPTEAQQIRMSWERLKSQAESFVVACEAGVYGNQPPQAGPRVRPA